MDSKIESDKTYEEIQTLMITKLCEDAERLGNDKCIWQHPMNDTVKSYCDSKGYQYTGLVGQNPPAKMGNQYLIVM